MCMKKFFSFFVAALFSASMFAVAPTDVPEVTGHEAEDVQALFCPTYAEGSFAFEALNWGGANLALQENGAYYSEAMTWDAFTNWAESSYDVSAFKKLHFDIWVPERSKIKVTFEALGVGDGGSGYKNGVEFKLNEGWNTIDADLEWWKDAEEVSYNFADMRYLILEAYQKPVADTEEAEWESAEGNELAIANVYFWKAPKVIVPDAPQDPTRNEANVMALFSKKYQTNTLSFAPTSWGSQWVSPEDNANYFYTADFGWDAFTNWDASSYNVTDYDMFHLDIYVTVASKIKVTFEALGAGDGGTGWKNGIVIEGLEANKWNSVDIDVYSTFTDYEFTDMRYLILEGFQLTDGTSAEHTPVGVTNAYFYSTLTAIEDVTADENGATKRMVNGRLVIERNGRLYNAVGAEL